MNNRARAALATVACLVALTGCVKVDADLEVNSNETVSGSMRLGVDKQLVEASAQSLDDVRRQVESGIKQTSTEGVECKPFEDERFVGSTCELDEVPFAQMGNSSGEGVSFRKDGDQFVVTVNAGSLNRFPQAGRPSQVNFKITMPGKIVSHDPGASVSGRTATYDSLEKLGSVSLRSETGGGFPLWALILLLVVLLLAAAAAVFFLRRGRKQSSQPQYPPGQYPQGQYPPGQYLPGQHPQGPYGPQYGAQPGEQPMQYGQPGQPMQYGQPGQPMQYGQSGPGQQVGQQGQPNQPMQYGQPAPGQYPGQPAQGQPGQWGRPGQQSGQPGQPGQPPYQPGAPGQPPYQPGHSGQTGQPGLPGQSQYEPGPPPQDPPQGGGAWLPQPGPPQPGPPQPGQPGRGPQSGPDDSGRPPQGNGGGGSEQS